VDSRATDFLSHVDLGTRVVVRSRIEGGFSDALGVLYSRTSSHCAIDTRRGLITVTFGEVVLAREVPPPPKRPSPSQSPGRPGKKMVG
jgi:hypothetical protein